MIDTLVYAHEDGKHHLLARFETYFKESDDKPKARGAIIRRTWDDGLDAEVELQDFLNDLKPF
jgi:hypothetical protein